MKTNNNNAVDLIEELASVNEARALFYRILAQYYFLELTQDQIEKIAQQDFKGMSSGSALIEEGFCNIHSYLSKRNTGTRQLLAADYAHTFLAAGNYETFAATPFESVFTSDLGLLMQDARDDVYRMYCKEHVQPEEYHHVPEDHVSFEFEFLGILLERINQALSRADYERALDLATTFQTFHVNHQLNWIDDLCDAVIDVSETDFYKGISKITRGFVHMETEVCDDVIECLQEIISKTKEL